VRVQYGGREPDGLQEFRARTAAPHHGRDSGGRGRRGNRRSPGVDRHLGQYARAYHVDDLVVVDAVGWLKFGA